jgi:hypothetical protein
MSQEEFEALKGQLETKRNLLNSKGASKQYTESDIEELKSRIKELYPKAPFHNPNFPKDLKQLSSPNSKADSSETRQINDIEQKLVSLHLESNLNDLISKATATSLKLKDAYLELFKLQDSQRHGYKIPSNKSMTFPSTAPVSNDPIAQKAAAMLAQRMQMLNLNKQASETIPTDAQDRIGVESKLQGQKQVERDQNLSQLKNEISQLNNEFSSLISSLKGGSADSEDSEIRSLESERKKYEEGYGLKSYRANRLLDELKKISLDLIYPPESTQQPKPVYNSHDELFSPTKPSDNSPFASQPIFNQNSEPQISHHSPPNEDPADLTFENIAQSSRRARDLFSNMESSQKETVSVKSTGTKWQPSSHSAGMDSAFDSLAKQKELEKESRLKAKEEEDRKRRQIYEDEQRAQSIEAESIQSAARNAREKAHIFETSAVSEPPILQRSQKDTTDTDVKASHYDDNQAQDNEYENGLSQPAAIPPPPPPPPAPQAFTEESSPEQSLPHSDFDSQGKPSLGDSLFGVASPPFKKGHAKKHSASNPFNTNIQESTSVHNPFTKPEQVSIEKDTTNLPESQSLDETLFIVTALYDYDNESGFSFNIGDEIHVTVDDDDNPDWW